MINVAIDPSETRASAVAAPRLRMARIALFGLVGVAGMGGFALGANHLLSGFAGPQRAPAAIRQKAADWPDLKDGLPSLAGEARPSAGPVVREATPAPAVRPHPEGVISAAPIAATSARVDPPARTTSLVPGAATAAAMEFAAPKPQAVAERPARPLPAIVSVPVIEPARQAKVVSPARTVQAVAPLPAETIRARTAGTAIAALPAEPTKAKLRPDPQPKPVAASKPTAPEKAAARKPSIVEASAAPLQPVADEETEVFGIKMPSLAPAGRKIRESVEALGNAVKALPDRF